MKKRKIIFFIAICIVVSYMIISIYKVEALSKYGSRGEEVKRIQTKLKEWGYYSGGVDGIFGSQTFEAVKKFQSKNGLTVDGIVVVEVVVHLLVKTIIVIYICLVN